MTSLSVNNLQIPFSKSKDIHPISFETDKPALIFITGPNGIGKSTLLKQLAGIIPSHETIMINEKAIEKYSTKEKASLIGVLNQAHQINFPLLVKDLVVMGLYNQSSSLAYYSKKDFETVFDTLKALNIDYLYEQDFLTLSGGEQQLCLLAQLSLQNPGIILLDEPTQSLDLYNKEKVFEWMRDQVKRFQKTIVCVTHDLHWLSTQEGYLLVLKKNETTLKEITAPLISATIDYLKQQQHC